MNTNYVKYIRSFFLKASLKATVDRSLIKFLLYQTTDQGLHCLQFPLYLLDA